MLMRGWSFLDLLKTKPKNKFDMGTTCARVLYPDPFPALCSITYFIDKL